MVRGNSGRNAKVEAKKDVVKSRTISSKITIAAIIASAALLMFCTQDASGVDPISPDVQTKIDRQYSLSLLYRNKAHSLAHISGRGHKYHKKLSNKKSNLSYEITRKNKWKKIYLYEKVQFRQVKKCVGAGFPRALCPKIILGAKQERKLTWAFDPNLAWIVKHESGFRPCVVNGGSINCNYHGSRSYGLFQFIGSTWGSVGCKITSNPSIQTRCGIRYIHARYHNPAGAVAYWRAHNSY